LDYAAQPQLTLYKRSSGISTSIIEDQFRIHHDPEDIRKVLSYSVGEIYFSKVKFFNVNSDSKSLDKQLTTNAYIIVENAESNTQYILSITIDFNLFVKSTILSSLDEIKLHIADANGDYLFHADQQYYLNNDLKNNLIFDNPAFSTHIADNTYNLFFEKFSINGSVYPAHYSILNLSEHGFEHPLRLLLLYDDPHHLAELNQLRNKFILLGFLFSLISSVIFLVLVHYLLRPLNVLTKTIGEYYRSNDISALPVNSKDEIGQLARSFHNLLKNLQSQKDEINRTRHYLDGITNKAPVMLAYVDKFETYRFVNFYHEQWMGLPQANFIGLCLADVMSEHDYKDIKPYINKVLLGETVNFQKEWRNSEGQTKYTNCTFTPEFNNSGLVNGFYTCIEDITQTKQDALEIEKLSHRIDFALEAPGIGIWDYDLISDKFIWDERMFNIYQVPPEYFEPTFETWLSRIHPDDENNVRALMDDCMISGEDFITEFRIFLPGESVRWIALHGRFIIGRNNSFSRMIGTNVDITSRKKLMIEREEALNKAEESANLKSEFLASMSHEIRTPMNGVLGMLGLLERTDLNKQQQHYARLAHGSAESLLEIINDILDFSKVEAGKMEIETIDFQLSNLIGEISESLGQKAQDKGLELVLDMTKISCTHIIGDPGRIRQIITNLLSNAIKFTDHGEIYLEVETIDRDSLYPELICRVRDTGIGIPQEKINTLFDSFSQVDASTTRKYGGTGLGLSIVKRLCELMGGYITVSSELGKGSEFTVTLKLQYSLNSIELLPPVDISSRKIVLVDDNQSQLTVLAKQLNNWGIETLALTNPDHLIDILHDIPVDTLAAVFIDSEMPSCSASDLGKRIREYRKFDTLHIIMMTKLSHPLTNNELKGSGFSSAFPKPITMNDLFNVFHLLADKTKTPESLGALNNPCLPAPSLLKTIKTDNKEHDYNEKGNVKDKIILAEKKNIDQSIATETSEAKHHSSILLVEDNIVNQEVALGILMGLGYKNIDIANNGVEALNQLNNSDKHYDIILMDCQMPEMDGYETTRLIRAGKAPNPQIPIVAMTANAMKGDREKCLAAGMSAYTSKPIDPERLQAALDEWVSESQKQGSVKASSQETLADPIVSDDIWDEKGFMKRIMNNEKIAEKLIDVFMKDTPQTIDQLEHAIDDRRVEDAGKLAHKLKGSVSNLGGIQLAEVAKNIEQAGKNMDLDEVKLLWPNVRPNFENLKAQIERRSD
jgi:PAS domain S-box-containing protein